MIQDSTLDRRAALAGMALTGALGLCGATAPPRIRRETRGWRFPAGFVWGAATAAYQVEGAVAADGRGASIWDTFSHTPGKVRNGDTGDVACDSYHRFGEDIALLKAMGLTSYRFSIAWPRIQAEGLGPGNQKGLDHYRRLSDTLLAAGIRPLPTLYHWDLPQPLEDAGGWPNRDTASRFADYAAIVSRELGDRVRDWALFNEPATFTQLGYMNGGHAPGRKEPHAFLRATHVVNLAQGMGFRAVKAAHPRLRIGGAFDVSPMEPATGSAEDAAAAERVHRFRNLWFIETALRGAYPPGVLPADRLADLLAMRPGDEAAMRAPFDFVGLNNYTRSEVRHDPTQTAIPGLDAAVAWAVGPFPRTDFDWAIYPEGFYRIIKRIHETTGDIPLEITENGAAYHDAPGADGRVRDVRRIEFYRAYLAAMARAMAEGAPVRGYHAWSLLDNFEWAAGYGQRFGLAYVDFATQRRTLKDSGRWFGDLARTSFLEDAAA